ncbi:hypothetical protein LguiA_012021 [Lonicera macranthoides]
MKNVDQNHCVRSKGIKNEELVKCMSKLPTYLERGENMQDKALSVGVLDWRLLEKWQCNQKHIPNRTSRYSASSSDASSFFSTDGSSTGSSRGQSCSPARQKMRRPTLLCHLNASPNEGNSQSVESSVGNGGKFQDLKARPLKYQFLDKKTSQIEPKECKRKDSNPQSIPEKIISGDVKGYQAASSLKGKMKIQEGESIRESKKLHETYYNIIRDDCDEPRKTVVLLLPRDSVERNGQNSKVSTISSRNKIPEEKKVTTLPINSISIESSEGLDLKIGTSAANKFRNPSPTRRLIAGLSKIGRNSSSKDSVAVPQLSSKHVPAKNGEDPSELLASLDCLTHDNPNSTSRARSSPLRRLLDPLLKPKATDKACKSSSRQDRSCTLTSCRKVDVEAQNGPSTVQALVQIATKKNGLPLFTFAVNNSSNVLAATVRKLSPNGKGDPIWIYTFFTVRKMKKKNGSWLNQGGKVQGDDYIPNVVAQMKVSDPSFSYLSGKQFISREFVLFAAELGQLDQHQPKDELAAIVVKFPRKQSYDFKGESGLFGGNSGSFSSTVILPGGNHGVPSKGEPSPLIERWKTGGLCDCGGWDLGCRVGVLANQGQPSRTSSSTKAQQPTAQFELFSQGEVLNEKPVFSLSSFKNGIFSVEFNSALSLLQAFSICIAVLDSNEPF